MAGKPLPTALKAIKGTLQKCRTNKKEPKPRPGFPDPPAEVQGDALAEWDRVRQEAPWITRADRGALTLYCLLWQRLMMGQRGEASPMITSEITQFRSAMSSLGLDPAGRSRITAPAKEKEQADEWEGF